MSYIGYKLETYQQSCRQYRYEVENNPDCVVSLEVMEAFSWSRMIHAVTWTAESTINIHVGESGESESHEVAGADEPQDCIVSLAKADWVVDLASLRNKGI